MILFVNYCTSVLEIIISAKELQSMNKGLLIARIVQCINDGHLNVVTLSWFHITNGVDA